MEHGSAAAHMPALNRTRMEHGSAVGHTPELDRIRIVLRFLAVYVNKTVNHRKCKSCNSHSDKDIIDHTRRLSPPVKLYEDCSIAVVFCY